MAYDWKRTKEFEDTGWKLPVQAQPARCHDCGLMLNNDHCVIDNKAYCDDCANKYVGDPPTKLVILVRGGVVQAVYSTDTTAEVTLVDLDNDEGEQVVEYGCDEVPTTVEELVEVLTR